MMNMVITMYSSYVIMTTYTAALLTLLSHFRRRSSAVVSSSEESLPSLGSPQLLATPPSTNRVVYAPPLFVHPNHCGNHREKRTSFNPPTRLRRRQDSPVSMEIPTVNVPASMLNDHPTITEPASEDNDDSEFYEQLQQALTLSLMENNPEAITDHQPTAIVRHSPPPIPSLPILPPPPPPQEPQPAQSVSTELERDEDGMCPSVGVSVHMCVCVFVCMYVSTSVFVSTYVCIFECLFMCVCFVCVTSYIGELVKIKCHLGVWL